MAHRRLRDHALDYSRDYSLYEEGLGVKGDLFVNVDGVHRVGSTRGVARSGGQWLSSLYCLLGGEDLVGGTLR